jgi:glycosyltransferase involved in cell wall biosynthesis
VKISIVIPCKNEEAVLGDLLDSIVAQTRQPDEIIVVDSHCTDNTIKLAKSYQKELPLKTVEANEKGVAHARNTGGRAVTSDYIIFLDADATIPPDYVEIVLRNIETRRLEVAASPQHMPSKKLGLRAGAHVMTAYMRLMSLTPWPIAISGLVSSKKAFDILDGFDPELWIMEDYDYALRARRHSLRFGVIRGTYFNASSRRYESSSPKDMFKGAYAEFYRYTHGLRLTKPLYTYEMGGKNPKKDKKS